MINYKLEHENAKAPVQASNMAAGFDLWAAEILRNNQREFWVDTGVAFDLPQGMFGDLRARSSVSETGLILANGAGVLDPDYTGTVQFRFYKVGTMEEKKIDANAHLPQGPYPVGAKTYAIGERVGQIVFQPYASPDLTEVGEIEETERGSSGFGSTTINN